MTKTGIETMLKDAELREWELRKQVGQKPARYWLDLQAQRDALLAAAKAASLTYKALARNHKLILEAAQAKGWSMGWLSQELTKAERLDAAIRLAEID